MKQTFRPVGFCFQSGAIIFALLGFAFSAQAQRKEGAGRMTRGMGVAEGQAVPKVSAKDVNGKSVDLSNPERYTVLVFGPYP
mgnify:CR=1 FL=1